MLYAIFIIYVVSGSLGMVLIKYGGKTSKFVIQTSSLSIQVSPSFVLGCLIYVFSFFLWIYILQKFQITFISPIAYGLVFIAILVFSYLFLHETVNLRQIIGTIVIIGGVLICVTGQNIYE